MKIEIKLHDNSTIFEEMTDYNAQEVSDQLNDNTNNAQMIVLGETVISKHTIRMVRPADEEVAEKPVEEAPISE